MKKSEKKPKRISPIKSPNILESLERAFELAHKAVEKGSPVAKKIAPVAKKIAPVVSKVVPFGGLISSILKKKKK